MTEPSTESLSLAERLWWTLGSKGGDAREMAIAEAAREIDTLTEQRVAAERERCATIAETEASVRYPGSLLQLLARRIALTIRAPADRPAPEADPCEQRVAAAVQEERERCLGIASSVSREKLPEPYWDNARARRMDWETCATRIKTQIRETDDRPAFIGATASIFDAGCRRVDPIFGPVDLARIGMQQDTTRCSTPSQEDTGSVSGERAPGWYWTKLWPGAEWQPTKYHFEGGIIGENPEGFWRIHGQSGVLLDKSFAEIGPRIAPPTDAGGLGSASNAESSSTQTVAAPGPTAGDVERADKWWDSLPNGALPRFMWDAVRYSLVEFLRSERTSARAELLAQIRDDVAAVLDGKIEMFSLQRARPGQPPRWCALARGSKRAAYGDTPAEAVQRALADKLTERKSDG